MRRVVCIAKNLPARVVPDVSTFDFLPCSFVRKRKKRKIVILRHTFSFFSSVKRILRSEGGWRTFSPPFFLKSFILFIRDKSIAPKETYMSSSLLGYSLHSRCVYLRHVLLYCRDRWTQANTSSLQRWKEKIKLELRYSILLLKLTKE